MSASFDLAIYLLIFSLILIVIGIFIVIQYLQVEKVARPFLMGLFLYFFLMALVNLIQMYEYLVNPSAIALVGIYNNYFAVICVFIAPIPLIFQIEKTYFENKLFAKFHLATLTVLVITAIFLALTAPSAISDPLFFATFTMTSNLENVASWAIIVLFICGAFLQLGIKSSGKYRLYSLVISFGWGVNQVINAAGQLALALNITVIFVIKIVAAVVTAYGFIKLYNLRDR